MAIRVRYNGTMWCAAHTVEEEGDTYIDDALHYHLAVERGIIVAFPMPKHLGHPEWWWSGCTPIGVDKWRSLPDVGKPNSP